MPDWLTGVLVQFPIVVVMGLLFWYVEWRMRRLYDASLLRADAAHAGRLATVEQQLAQVNDLLAGEMRVLTRRIETLNRKLS